MTRSYNNASRAAKAEASRSAILAAFAEQLGRPGATDVSVPEAAAAAGVSVRTVYHHFPDQHARSSALAEWVEQQFATLELPPLRTAADLADLTRALYARAAANTTLLRAQVAAGFALPVRLQRLAARRARIAEVLAAIGAPADLTRRATAVVMTLMSAEAGLPLVDVHGLSFDDAGTAAAEAVAAVVAALRSAT